MPRKTEPEPCLYRDLVAHTKATLDDVDRYLLMGDFANAAGCAYLAAQAAVSLVDDLRFEQGVKAGLARAKRGPRKGKR